MICRCPLPPLSSPAEMNLNKWHWFTVYILTKWRPKDPTQADRPAVIYNPAALEGQHFIKDQLWHLNLVVLQFCSGEYCLCDTVKFETQASQLTWPSSCSNYREEERSQLSILILMDQTNSLCKSSYKQLWSSQLKHFHSWLEEQWQIRVSC